MVVNAAGLYGDQVELIHQQKSDFKILPRKGDYAIFDKDARKLVRNIILPVPTEKTKGIIIFPTVHGNVMVGPTAEDIEERDVDKVTAPKHVVDSLVNWAEKVVPSLKTVQVIGTYCGIRPATQFKDYQIKFDSDRRWMTVGGIRSTGATACMGIANHVASTISRHNNQTQFCRQNGKDNKMFEKLNWKKDEYIKGNVKIDGKSYYVTHPITRFGLFDA